MTLEDWLNWFYIIHQVIESNNWSLVLFSSQCQVKTMKSKYYNIQVSYSSCDVLLEIFDGLQIYLSWILFWMKNHFAYWKMSYLSFTSQMWLENLYLWHLVLICTLCFKFLNFQSIYGIFMSFHDSTRFIFEFLLKLLIWVSWWFSCNIWDFWIFYMSNDPKLELDLRKLAEFRLVRFLVARTVRGYGADSPPFIRIVHQRLCREVVNRRNSLRTVRQRTADSPPVLGSICQRQFQSGGSVKNQRRTVR